MPSWDCVSPTGIKMNMDDPYHTDWVLGAGLDIDESYSENVSGPAWSIAFDMQIKRVDDD